MTLPFQVLTVGEPAAGPGAGPITGLGFGYALAPFLALSQVAADLDPNTLNLKSAGRFFTAFFEITGFRSAAEISPATLKITRINGQDIAPIPAEPGPVALQDSDGDGSPELMVKFDRQALIQVLPVAVEVKVTLEGKLLDGSPFRADAFIRAIRPGAGPRAVAMSAMGQAGAEPDLTADIAAEGTQAYLVRVSAERPQDTAARATAARAKRAEMIGSPFRLGPAGFVLASPAVIRLPLGASAGSLAVARWDSARQAWEVLESSVDKGASTVAAKTRQASLYQLLSFGEGSAAGAALPDSTFRLGSGYVFPNPARGGARPVIHIEAGVADRVTLRILDISGREVHQAALEGGPAIVDDGAGPKFAYEYAWEGYIPSGVYIYAAEAEKSGFGPLRKAGKFAVVR